MAKPWKIRGLRPESSVSAGIARIIKTRCAEMYSYADKTLIPGDPEALHDMRVSSRRLQAVLKIHRESFPPRKFRRIYTPLRDLIKALGMVRELDVFLQSLQLHQRENQNIPEETLRPLVAQCEHERTGHRKNLDTLIRTLVAGDYQREVHDFVNLYLKETADRTGRASRQKSFRQFGAWLIPRLYDRFADRRAEVIRHPQQWKELHNMRIAGKPLRYAMEIYEVAYGRTFRECLEHVKLVLDTMGFLHDTDVALGKLHAYERSLSVLTDQAIANTQHESVRALIELYARERSDLFRKFAAVMGEWKKNKFRRKLMKSLRHN